MSPALKTVACFRALLHSDSMNVARPKAAAGTDFVAAHRWVELQLHPTYKGAVNHSKSCLKNKRPGVSVLGQHAGLPLWERVGGRDCVWLG